MLGAGDIGMCGQPEVAETARLVAISTAMCCSPATSPTRRERRRTSAIASIRSGARSDPGGIPSPAITSESAGAAPYFAYFGEAAGPPGLGYYSFTAGDWLLLMLNSNVPATRGSPQWEFVRTELERQRTPCTMAVWHHPLFTSGPNGNNTFMRDMWALLEASRVEVIFNGHDHLYERFARQTADGSPDPINGIRQFTAGTGGAELYRFVGVAQNSEERIMKFGVVRFTLRPAQVDWEFLGIDGSVGDRGLDTCR